MGRELRQLEDTVARGFPALEQQLLRLETDLPRLIREQNRGLPEWTDDRIDRRLAPIDRLLLRTRNSAARVHHRAHALSEDLQRLRARTARLARELEKEDPRLDRIEDRLARTTRVLEESRRESVRRGEISERSAEDLAERVEQMDLRSQREGERLEARLDAIEPRFRSELEHRFDQLPRIEARLQEELEQAVQEARSRELERAEGQQQQWAQWTREERGTRDEHEQGVRETLELLGRQLNGLRRHRERDYQELEERLERFTRGMEEPIRLLERRFDTAVLEDRKRAARWRVAFVVFALGMVLWQLLSR